MQQNRLFLSTNAQAEEDSNLGNEIGNIYNLSGEEPAIDAFSLETALKIPDGFLSPDIDNFVEAFEGSAARKRFFFPQGFTYNFGWTFYSNDERRDILNPDTLEFIDASDYAFLLVKKIIDPQEDIEEIYDFIRLTSVNESEDLNLFIDSDTAGGIRERNVDGFTPVIEMPFVRESSGIYNLTITEDGIYDLSFGIVDVDDFGDSTSGLAIWERDFGDAPDRPVNSNFFYDTLLQNNGPRYYEGEFQRLGTFKDGEHNGRPTIQANGDDNIPSPFVFSRQLDDEDGVVFGKRWIDVIFNISRLGDHPYQLRAWADFNENKIFDHPSELFIDDLLILNPDTISDDPEITVLSQGLFKKRYFVSEDLRKYYTRFRLTWDPLGLDITPQGEFFSSPDCPISLVDCLSHGEVEDYKIPETSITFGLLIIGILGLMGLKEKSNSNK